MDTKNRQPIGDFHAEREINLNRRQERAQDICCKVFDFTAQFFTICPLDEVSLRNCAREAVEKFHGLLPDDYIENLVVRQFQIEEMRSRSIALMPKPVRKDIYGRPILPKKSVVPSTGKPTGVADGVPSRKHRS